MYNKQITVLVPVAVVVAGNVLGTKVGFDVNCEVATSVKSRSVQKPLTMCFVLPMTTHLIWTQLNQFILTTSKNSTIQKAVLMSSKSKNIACYQIALRGSET